MKRVAGILCKIGFGMLLACFLLWCGGLWILPMVGCTWRPWVHTVALISIIACVLILLIWVTVRLWKWKRIPSWSKVLILLVSLFAIVVIGYYALFLLAFGYAPEHIVEKDGKQMLACVYSWLDTRVDYHAEYGLFWMSEQETATEVLHTGSDPFADVD